MQSVTEYLIVLIFRAFASLYSIADSWFGSGHSNVWSVDQGFCFPKRGSLRSPLPFTDRESRLFDFSYCSWMIPRKQSLILCCPIMSVSSFRSLSLGLTFFVFPNSRSTRFDARASSTDSSIWFGLISLASVDWSLRLISASSEAEKSFRSYSFFSSS